MCVNGECVSLPVGKGYAGVVPVGEMGVKGLPDGLASVSCVYVWVGIVCGSNVCVPVEPNGSAGVPSGTMGLMRVVHVGVMGVMGLSYDNDMAVEGLRGGPGGEMGVSGVVVVGDVCEK